MHSSEPLHVAFVWHMHQPYYRSPDGAFEMPWARMHALKDYLDMVDTLSAYPDLHQTFNLVPSLVEQLEVYASGTFTDVYWDHTIRPADELDSAQRIFVIERMCEPPDHPRARARPRYLELAHKREHHCPHGAADCAQAFSDQEICDLQVWFNLAWCDQRDLQTGPLSALVEKGRDFSEQDKQIIADHQASVLKRVLPAYREALDQGRVELSTSPYFHPILPLLCDTDSARVASPDVVLPPRRFSHPEDATEQLTAALTKHEQVFGRPARGVWCSEQAVGEDVLPLLMRAGVDWTISDEAVLTRSLSGVTPPAGRKRDRAAFGSPYAAHKITRGAGELSIVFRDHTLSDLIGFTYHSWDSRDAATDLLGRLGGIRQELASSWTAPRSSHPAGHGDAARDLPLVVIALDGENAWEHYPNDGHDFLGYLYEGLSSDESLRCVTISEHLQASPPSQELPWLHTGSWIAADLRTWCGSQAQNLAWDSLHRARDLVARQRSADRPVTDRSNQPSARDQEKVEAAWHEIMVAQGSDWFWWFGDHHHTELDSVWDGNFRLHLQEAYRLLGQPVPERLSVPFADVSTQERQSVPSGPLAPSIDGRITHPTEWQAAGYLTPDLTSAMQPAEAVRIAQARFGWQERRLCLLVTTEPGALKPALRVTVGLSTLDAPERPLARLVLAEDGRVDTDPGENTLSAEAVEAAWGDVLEIALDFDPAPLQIDASTVLMLRVGETQVFHSAGIAELAPEGP